MPHAPEVVSSWENLEMHYKLAHLTCNEEPEEERLVSIKLEYCTLIKFHSLPELLQELMRELTPVAWDVCRFRAQEQPLA